MNIRATAAGLSDQDLLTHIEALAGNEREALVDLVAHLAALDTRPKLYAAKASAPSSAIAPRLFGCPRMPRAIGSTPPGHAGAFP